MVVSEKETKTHRELEQMIADLSGLRPNVIAVHKIGREGNFGANVIAGIGHVSAGAAVEHRSDLRSSEIEIQITGLTSRYWLSPKK